MNELSWFWIALELIVPPLMALLVAFPFWRQDQMIFGNIVGTGVIFGSAIALILREHVELDRVVQQCLEAGDVCWPHPSAFTRFALYASIGLIEVLALFALSLKVEQKIRGRGYAPDWRR